MSVSMRDLDPAFQGAGQKAYPLYFVFCGYLLLVLKLQLCLTQPYDLYHYLDEDYP